MASLIKLDEFAAMSGKEEHEIFELCSSGKLNFVEQEDGIYIDVAEGTKVAIAQGIEVLDPDSHDISNVQFMEKTIGTIVAFHEKVMVAKDETIDALKSENMFLKDGLLSMQDIYDTDKDSIKVLNEQLKIAQEELEFVKRKYKLMWGQVIEKQSQGS